MICEESTAPDEALTVWAGLARTFVTDLLFELTDGV